MACQEGHLDTSRLPPWHPKSNYKSLLERDDDESDGESHHPKMRAIVKSSISQHWDEFPDEAATAFSRIIDAYRLRVKDEYSMVGNAWNLQPRPRDAGLQGVPGQF
jgi:hypothetical protein